MDNAAKQSNGATGGLRASDLDRDRTARRLSDALAEGRITQDEHAERLDAVYAAKTLDELVPVTRDLPHTASAGTSFEHTATEREPTGSATGSENIVAVLGAAERRGRWLVEPRTNASAVCGSVELDLREAVMAQREVTVQCALICSGLRLIVPPGVRVTNQTSTLLAGVDLCGYDPPDVATSVVSLTGICVLAGVEVRTRAAGCSA